MNIKHLQKVCHTLANKYNDPSEYEDLLSEGILAGLEALKRTDEEGLVVSAIRKAMYDYYNIDSKAMSLPRSAEVHSVNKQLSEGCEDFSGRYLLIAQALSNRLEPIQSNTLRESVFEADKRMELRLAVETMKDVLDDDEYDLIVELYLKGRTLEAYARGVGKSCSTINRCRNSALDKVKRAI